MCCFNSIGKRIAAVQRAVDAAEAAVEAVANRCSKLHHPGGPYKNEHKRALKKAKRLMAHRNLLGPYNI